MFKLFITALCILAGGVAIAQTEGELSVAVTTSSTGGNFAPRNIVAIWIESESGEFIKTLLAYGERRKTHLNNWEKATTNAGTAFNRVDAVTDATRSSHGTRSCSWDGTNYERTPISDGQYKLCMELTDKNSTGNYSAFNFNKTAESLTLTPADVPSFSNISIEWTPTKTSSAFETGIDMDYSVFPSPTAGNIEISGEDIQSIEITDLNGKLVCRETENRINVNLTGQPNGIYFVHLITPEKTIVKRIIKQEE